MASSVSASNKLILTVIRCIHLFQADSSLCYLISLKDLKYRSDFTTFPITPRRRQWHPTPVLLPGNPMDGGGWWAAVQGVAKSRTRLSDFTFTFHFHTLEKEMATHSSVPAWRISGMGEPSGLPSMGSRRVGHNWSDLAAAAAAAITPLFSSFSLCNW